MADKAQIKPGSRLALQVDERGVWLYGNNAGLVSLAERLLRIANADPNECYECHTRMELGDHFGLDKGGEVSLILDEELKDYFSRLPADAPVEARPFGFELTFMHINDVELDKLKNEALQKNQA